jgi:hypothetical protein
VSRPAGPPFPELSPPGEIERYLAEVTARLPGPRAAHPGIVAELRSGLLDASDGYLAAGLSPAAAARAAVREFGAAGLVADGFRTEIGARHARRVATILLVSGPLVGLLWLAVAAASRPAVRIAAFWHWTTVPAGLGAGLQLVAVAITVTALAGALSIASAGRLSRWVPAAPGHAPLAAAVAACGAVGADGLGLALLAAELAVTQGKLPLLPAAAAAAASAARLLLARRAASRCLAMRTRPVSFS